MQKNRLGLLGDGRGDSLWNAAAEDQSSWRGCVSSLPPAGEGQFIPKLGQINSYYNTQPRSLLVNCMYFNTSGTTPPFQDWVFLPFKYNGKRAPCHWNIPHQHGRLYIFVLQETITCKNVCPPLYTPGRLSKESSQQSPPPTAELESDSANYTYTLSCKCNISTDFMF